VGSKTALGLHIGTNMTITQAAGGWIENPESQLHNASDIVPVHHVLTSLCWKPHDRRGGFHLPFADAAAVKRVVHFCCILRITIQLFSVESLCVLWLHKWHLVIHRQGSCPGCSKKEHEAGKGCSCYRTAASPPSASSAALAAEGACAASNNSGGLRW
jgi:hypothetical protein